MVNLLRNFSENTNASRSDLPGQDVPLELPAPAASTTAEPQLGMTAVDQSTPTAALARETNSVASAADGPAELDLQFQGRRPVEPNVEAKPQPPAVGPTGRQTSAQAPQVSPEPPPSRFCWDKAVEDLQKSEPDIYKKLKQMRSEDSWNENDLRGLQEKAGAKAREGKKIPHWLETSIRSILRFKDVISAATSFDPYNIAPLFWQGFCVVFEVSMVDFIVYHRNYNHPTFIW